MQIITIAEFIGIIAFAISGAMVAIEKNLDYYGVVVLSILTALGGGVIRDVIIGQTPPFAFVYPVYAITAIITALLSIKFDFILHKLSTLFKLFDTLGLAAFAVIGARVSIDFGFDTFFMIVAITVITSTGGGILRDICAKEIPAVLQKGEVYTIAVIAGASFYALTYQYLHINAVELLTFLITFGIRFYCSYKNVKIHIARSSYIPADKD